MDPLRVYVVHDVSFEPAGPLWVAWLAASLSGLGMQRDEARFGVQVFWRSRPWGRDQPGLPGTSHPRRIRLADAASNCVLLLVDGTMASFRQAQWTAYVEDLKTQMLQRQGVDLLVPVLMTGTVPKFADGPQAIRAASADLPKQPKESLRFLVRFLNALLVHRQPNAQRTTHQPGHGIFVSHAKRDGWKTAKRIVAALSQTGEGTRPAFFLDADSLAPGADYETRFVEAIGAGSLLALVTDAYHTRPWCRWEVLTAKRLGRPIVVADLCAGRVERTLPYLGNVPTERLAGTHPDHLSDEDIDRLALALLSEALRFELWNEHALQRMAGTRCRLLARPPELADLIQEMSPQNGDAPWVVYPDPPLGHEEVDLLQKAFPGQHFFSINQALSRK
jgi:hypothetical protein